MTLIWTRAAADWGEDQALLAGINEVVCLPCLHTTALLTGAIKQYDVYTAVSARIFQYVTLPKGATVHTFGKATAEAAMSSGALTVCHQAGTAAELATKLVHVLARNQTIGVLSAAEPAFDLGAALCSQGLNAETIAVYQTQALAVKADGSRWTASDAFEFAASVRGVVCFASPSAVRGFVETFPTTRLTAVCIGPTTAKAAVGHFEKIVTATGNSLAELVGLAATLDGV